MSSILLTWLNTEVDLSKKITNIESDFSNGYLLGELLHKFNQLTNIEDFRNENTRAAKMSNFDILHQVLQNVGVDFKVKTAEDIMNCKPGVISNLLYEIRSNLEKKGVNPDNISLKKSSHFQELYASMKFRQEIPQYTAFENKHFIDTLQRRTRAQKEVDMEKKLKKFEDFKVEQDKKIKEDIKMEEIRKRQRLMDSIKEHRNKNQRYHAFLQQFEENGINKWKENMLRGKTREMKDVKFQLNQANKITNNLEKIIKNTVADYKKKVDQFEAKFGVKKRSSLLPKASGALNGEEYELSQEFDKINGETILAGKSIKSEGEPAFENVEKKAEEVKDKIFARIMLDQRTKTERNRRRRKIIVEQGKAQLEIENKRREEQYISKLKKQSNQEKQLTYEVYRVNQCKKIMKENEENRQKQFKERKEKNIKFAELNEAKFLEMHTENFRREVEKEEEREKDLEISLKQKVRNKNSNDCKHMVELIIEITNGAYKYQQTNDCDDIEDRIWREWINLFINNHSIYETEEELNALKENQSEIQNEEISENKQDASEEQKQSENLSQTKENKENLVEANKPIDDNNSHVSAHLKSKYSSTFYSIFNPDSKSTKLDQILDECEFTDYVNFMGQWDKKLIPEDAFRSITSEDLSFEYSAPAADANQGKKDKAKEKKAGAKDGTDDLIKNESPENLIIPKENVRNELFGDLIDILIDIRYDEEEKQKEEENSSFKNIFKYVPIKIAIIGQDFSGKRTQAKILSENFPFKIYDVQELIKDALNMLNNKSNDSKNDFNFSIKTENNSDKANEDLNPVDQMMQEKIKKNQKNIDRIKALARQIQNRLLNGETIEDDIYAQILIEYIKQDFPPKEDSEVKVEILNRVEQIEEIEAKIEENREQNAVSRPNYFAKQDKIFNDELMMINLEATKGFVVVNYPCSINQAKALECRLSGYVSKEDACQSRREKLKEIFSCILEHSEKLYPKAKLIKGGFDIVFYLNVPSSECIRRACGRRQYIEDEEKVVYHLDDNKPVITKNICEKMTHMNDITRSESCLVTRHLAFSQGIDSIIKFYKPFGFEERKVNTFQEINGFSDKEHVTQDIISFVNDLVEYNQKLERDIYEQNIEENSNKEEEEGEEIGDFEGLNEAKLEGELMEKKSTSNENKEEEKKEEEKKEEVEEPLDDYEKYIQKIEKIKGALNKELSVVLLKIWTKLFENYVSECKSIFKFLRVQRDEISENYKMICEKFIVFLKRPSKKQILLLDYQMEYNKFIDDYPDLRDEPQVKEEHHQKVDDLNDKIYEIIETRKNEAVDERKKIMTSGWIENEMEKFYMALERLFQNEIDKFIGAMQIIRDYYHNLDNRPLVELPFSTIEIIKEEIDTTPIEEFAEDTAANPLPEKYPRIEKLYKTALKTQFQYEEAIRESERNRLEKQNEGQKNKAPAKGKKQSQQNQTEEPKDSDYPHYEELMKAISNEKAKFKYKITLLKYWGISYLQNVRKLSLSIYSKLEDWIILAIKAENEALNQLCKMLKENIESESKIKYELALDTFDVVVNMDVQNFIELPPALLPAKEVINHDKFNIVQLKILLEELQSYLVNADELEMEMPVNNEFIRSSTFISIFIKKYIASKNDSDVYYGIPNLLKNLSFYNYFKFIKKLDPNNKDFVSLKQIGCFFALLNSPLPNEDNISAILSQVAKIKGEETLLTCEEFTTKIEFWFDENEKSETLPNHEDFHRDQELKKVLFDLMKNEEDLIDINSFINIITLKCIDMYKGNFEGKTYYEVLFF